MKIGEWDEIGRGRGLIQRQLGQLGATEDASHVTVNPENGRMHIFVATDVGLLDYSYAPAGMDASGPWMLRGQAYRWPSVRGLRLQTDAQLEPSTGAERSIWRLTAEDPRIELAAATDESGDQAIEALLALARACFVRTG